MVGDDAGFEVLFTAEYARLVRTAFLILGDPGLAQEVVQEAFARALARWERIAGYDRPGAWVRLVTVRLALRARDHRRREAVDARAEEVVAPGEVPLDDQVVSAVLALPRSQRAVVALHYLDDLSVDEVASTLGLRPSTVRVHLHRARTRLADLLREEVADG